VYQYIDTFLSVGEVFTSASLLQMKNWFHCALTELPQGLRVFDYESHGSSRARVDGIDEHLVTCICIVGRSLKTEAWGHRSTSFTPEALKFF
jgi:hypothetical protein